MKLKSRHINGIVPDYYNTEDNRKISYTDIEEVVKDNKIDNAEWLDDGVIWYSPEIKDEASIKEWDITGVLINDYGEGVGYELQNLDSKTFRLSRNKVWELALDGRIRGVSARINGEIKVLEADDISLYSRVPLIKI